MASARKRTKSKRNENPSVIKEKEEKEGGESSLMSPECQVYFTLGGALLFSCLCTAVIWYIFLRERGIEYTTIHTVPVITLSNEEESFAAAAVKKREPIIIRNSIVNKWRARKAWSPEYLRSKLKRLDGVYENDNPWFGPYYDTSKPLLPYSRRLNPYKTNLSLSGQEFFKRLENPVPGRYHYLTSDIDQLGEWAFGDVEPVDELLLPNPSRSSINVWIGQPNVIAHTHYDGYHNFYAQLYGRKKFTLLRPTQWPGLYPYPFLHPSHAQAQVNLSRLEDAKEFPLSSQLEVYEVTLEPGDLLYMPPLWFHYVQSLSVSISVNVWTDSKQSGVMEEVFGLTLPLNQVKWHGEHLKAIAGSMLLSGAVDRVCRMRNCPLVDKYNTNETRFKSGSQYFMFRLWNGRYSKLMERNEVHSSYTSQNKKGGVTRGSVLCEKSALPSLFFQGIAQKLYEAPVEEYLKKLSRLVSKLPKDTWELWFGNYVEYIAAQSVDLLDVGLFLKHYDSCSMHFPK